MAEDLDHLLAVQHFLNEAVYFAQGTLLFDKVPAGQAGEVFGDGQHDQCSKDRDDSKGGAKYEHGYQCGDHGDARINNLRDALADELAQGVHVVGVNRHDVAVSVGIKVLDGQSLHLVEQVVTQTAQGTLADVNHDAVVGVGGNDAYHHETAQLDNVLEQAGKVLRAAFQHGLQIIADQGLGEGG